MNLDDLHTFLYVVQEGSFTAAAKALDVPPSTVSRRVTRLEDDLGATLVHRGRKLQFTDEGELLHRRSVSPLTELADLGRALTDIEAPRGVLRLTGPPDLANSTSIVTMLAGFRAAWPDVTLDMVLTGRTVDLMAEGFDVALRAAARFTSPGLMMKVIGRPTGGWYASPDYLAGHQSDTHQLLVHRAVPAEPPFPTEVVAKANDFVFLTRLCMAGAGVALLPSFAVHDDVVEGRLVKLDAPASMGESRLALVWPESRHLSPRVRVFLDFVTAWVEEHGLFTQ